jgi:hypothetical protein
MAALGITALMGVAALALDIGRMLTIKSELQRNADAGALAGARSLWPSALPIATNPPYQPDCATAQNVALSVSTSANNKVDGAILTNGQVSVQTGRWDYASKTFTAGTGLNVNAVRVTTQWPVSLVFAQVLGIGSRNVSASATALADFAGGVGKGTLPIVIGEPFVAPGESIFINFTPDTEDNGAWFAYSSDPANAKTFRDYIDNATCPPLNAGDLINLQNGQDTSVLSDLQNKLAQQGGVWDVVLPVVNVTKFVGSAPITGFVAFRITQVVDTGGSKGITGTFLGMILSSTATPGGGSPLGVLSPPKLL